MARRKGAKTRPDEKLEARAAAAGTRVYEARKELNAAMAERTNIWFLMFNANDYTQRGIAEVTNRGIPLGAEDRVTEDTVEKALLRMAS